MAKRKTKQSPPRERVTLRDVASEAGLSVAAVSRALADDQQISSSTRKRVRQISQELGYQPRGRNVAKPLRGSSVWRRIGFVMLGQTEPNFGFADPLYMLAGLAAQQRCRLELQTAMPIDAEGQLRQLRQNLREVDGLLLYGRVNPQTLRSLSDVDAPWVLLGDVEGDPLDRSHGGHIVSAEPSVLGQFATRLLIEAGYKRIGFVCTRLIEGMWDERWLSGYKYAHFEAGLRTSKQRIITSEDDDRQVTGELAAERFARMKRPPDAYSLPNAYITASFVRRMRELKRPIKPSQLVFGGMVNDPQMQLLEGYPQVIQDFEQMVHSALHLLRMTIDRQPLPSGVTHVAYQTRNLEKIFP